MPEHHWQHPDEKLVPVRSYDSQSARHALALVGVPRTMNVPLLHHELCVSDPHVVVDVHPRKSNSWSGSRTIVGAGVGVVVAEVIRMGAVRTSSRKDTRCSLPGKMRERNSSRVCDSAPRICGQWVVVGVGGGSKQKKSE